VDFVGGADVDDVDFVELEEFVKIGEDAGDVEIGGEFAGDGLVEIADGDDFGVGDGAPAGVEMKAADDAAGADDADFEGFGHGEGVEGRGGGAYGVEGVGSIG
jgi:hypothetical protein